MARSSRSPAHRRARDAEYEDLVRQLTEILFNDALDRLEVILGLRDGKSPFPTTMTTKMVEKTALKMLQRRYKVETRGRKRTYPLGYFGTMNILDRGAQLLAEGIGASKAAEIIHEELKAVYKKIEVPTVSAIKGRLERSRR
jgi:hypothetical protein